MLPQDNLSSNWKTLRPKVRERWHSLTDQDLKTIDGNYDVLVSMLEEKYSYSKEMAEDEVNRFLNESAPTMQPMHS